MAYDEANGVTVLYSGASTSGLLGDTWYYHYPSNRWVQVSPADAPIPRKLAQAAYDPVNGRTMMYGGQSDVGMRNDMWSLKLSPVTGAPTVSLTAPAAGNTYTAPASVALSASASAVTTQGEMVVWKFLARNGPSG